MRRRWQLPFIGHRRKCCPPLRPDLSGGSYIPGQGGGAAAQHGQCAGIPWEEVQPRDLVFYPEDDHVGIAAGRDGQGRLLVVHCAAGAGGVTLSCSNGFTQAARPGWYGEE